MSRPLGPLVVVCAAFSLLGTAPAAAAGEPGNTNGGLCGRAACVDAHDPPAPPPTYREPADTGHETPQGSGSSCGIQVQPRLPHICSNYAGDPEPTVSTAELGQDALALLPLPKPLIVTAPPTDTKMLVNMPTWFWIAESQRGSQSKTARAGDVWATVTAEAFKMKIDPGDDSDPIFCRTPGKPYSSEADSDGACTYAYTLSGTYDATVTVYWAPRWHGSDGNGGNIRTLTRSSTVQLNVVEARSELIDNP